MYLTAMTFLFFWLLFTLLFIVFLFLTLNALGQQARFKLKLSVTLISFILGLISFVLIFTDQSLYKGWQNQTKFSNPLSYFTKHQSSQSKDDKQPNTKEPSTSEKPTDVPKTKDPSDAEVKAKGYNNEFDFFPKNFKPTTSSSKTITTSSKQLKVGKDIEPGFYQISLMPDEISSAIRITNPFGNSPKSAIINGAEFAKQNGGETSFTTYLIDGHTLILNQKEARKPNKFKIQPEKHVNRTTLTQGTYIVGTDIKPGQYQVTSQGRGNFIVDRAKREDDEGYNEIFKKGSVKSIQLKDGDIVNLLGISKVTLKPN